jgi:hypothetical protein
VLWGTVSQGGLLLHHDLIMQTMKYVKGGAVHSLSTETKLFARKGKILIGKL